MISYKLEGRIKRENAPGGYKRYVEGTCISTDTKPTNVANGSKLLEMDTSTMYLFDEESGEWCAWQPGSDPGPPSGLDKIVLLSDDYVFTDSNSDGNVVVTKEV